MLSNLFLALSISACRQGSDSVHVVEEDDGPLGRGGLADVLQLLGERFLDSIADRVAEKQVGETALGVAASGAKPAGEKRNILNLFCCIFRGIFHSSEILGSLVM